MPQRQTNCLHEGRDDRSSRETLRLSASIRTKLNTVPAYSVKAQPYLDAIAKGVFTSQEVRNWLIKDTPVQVNYAGSDVLFDEHRAVRWKRKRTRQPFWANYWCGRDSLCTCRIAGSKGLESDAIFFFRNHANRTLAVHVEFKHSGEAFTFGQPEAYPLRAICFTQTHHERPSLNAHNDWTTVIFCGTESLSDPKLSYFQRVITHEEAARVVRGYPDQTGLAGPTIDR